MSEKMEPCPRCHSDRVSLAYNYVGRDWYVRCPDCFLNGPSYCGFCSQKQAIALWNDMAREMFCKQPAKPDEVTAPAHYAGDGAITCKDAMASMTAGYDKGGVTAEQAYWSVSALKYLWRWPLKGSPLKDLRKARECLDLAIAAVEGGDRE